MHSMLLALLLVVCFTMVQVGEARLPPEEEREEEPVAPREEREEEPVVPREEREEEPNTDRLTEEQIKEMVDKFKADFRAEDRRVEFTSAELAWFASIGSDDWREERGRKKRSVLNPSKVRHEYRTLTTAQRNNLHLAFQMMKSTIVAASGVSQYDIFVNMHTFWMAPGAHGGAAFSGWHREFLWKLELVLQSHVSGVMIPYWDNNMDQQLPDPSASAIWTPAYLGNNNGLVNSGFAAGWTAPAGCPPATLTRNAWTGSIGQWILFSDANINQVVNALSFADIFCNHNCNFYWRHVLVHFFVGGHFAYSPCTPIDPVFWMHHAFIDCLWEEYRQTTFVQPEFDYPTASDPLNGGPAHYPEETMLPFSPKMNIHGLSDHYTNYYYHCAPRLTTTPCYSNAQCQSPILYCDTNTNKCKAKVRLGGNCSGMGFLSDVCDSTQCPSSQVGMCSGGTCICA